ncbi:MAG: 4-amino-4-deoxy-L-arabinose transferase [Holophagaceae bacterium]|jgi:multidrug transporter EmrE-like cation transporter
MNSLRALPWIISSVTLNALAQVFLKRGLGRVSIDGLSSFLPLLGIPWVWAGLMAYGVSLLVWLKALSLVPVSFAYPFLALGFILNGLFAYFFLSESIPMIRWVALILISVGILLQGMSYQS